MNPTINTSRINKQREDARAFANNTHYAEGRLTIFNEDNMTTYGFQDLRIWVPRLQKWILLTAIDQDKFMVTTESRADASREFYDRWRIFVQRAFNLTNLHINNIA